MRRLRLLISFLSLVLLLSAFLYIIVATTTFRGPSRHTLSRRSSNGFGAYFSFRNPASLFTPAATISLTDDNSTFFAARPAAFGPILPSRGLSGQIWVGSGFGDDSLGRRGIAAAVEGELGCSDIPGWIDRSWSNSRTNAHHEPRDLLSLPFGGSRIQGNARDPDFKELLGSGREQDDVPVFDSAEDGTDAHLHYPLSSTQVYRTKQQKRQSERSSNPQHADIQSLQESAEISGKIVLLSRGGCGFSEKVKWAQRRGAAAVIVGDNLRGGPLVRMFARGDTSNITIPSLFTSHTTAHLLSSLIPSGYEVYPFASVDDSSHRKTSKAESRHKAVRNDPRTFTQPSNDVGSSQTMLAATSATHLVNAAHATPPSAKAGWFKSSLNVIGLRGDRSRHAPQQGSTTSSGSGRLEWLRVGEFDEDESHSSDRKPTSQDALHHDGFVIGVHDWRDPDVVSISGQANVATSSPASTVTPTSRVESLAAIVGSTQNFRGGSITPGSGVYADAGVAVDGDSSGNAHDDLPPSFEGDAPSLAISDDATSTRSRNSPRPDASSHHEGLWVTLSPTTMSISPFFNTLFVLVVSPLVTLAVVYTMLLLRSRIRRRRWRAPKSVVERLPVRVYHNISSTSSSSAVDTPIANASSTTPLLADSRPVESGSRPRSRTIGASASTPSTYGSLGPASEQEKVESGLSEWRRRYGGKQKECAVCLDEYVDGVSRVMSLPCGHEFHVDCITPWLTTRRRTCPICKSDVVRGAGQEHYTPPPARHDDEDIQAQAAESRNLSPSASLPITQGTSELDDDLERQSLSSWVSRSWHRRLESLGRMSRAEETQAPRSSPDRDR